MNANVENPSKRRDRLVIMAEIMEIARNGALKTQIMYRANLSFSQLNEYIDLLTNLNLLEKSDSNGKEIFTTTKKGIEFMEKQNQIMELVRKEDVGRDCIRIPHNLQLARPRWEV